MNDNFCPSHTVVELDTWERKLRKKSRDNY